MGALVPLKKTPTTYSSIEKCPYCGKEKIPQTTELFGMQITVVLSCKCEIEAFDRKMAQIKNHEQNERQKLIHKNSGLTGAVQKLTFANFKSRQGTEDALQVAHAFVDNWEDRLRTGAGFTLAGTYGNGKSHLAAAVIHELINHGISATYQPVAELLKRVKATYDGSRETEAQILEWLHSVKCLALDDIGAQKQTKWVEEFIFTVIDHRYRHRLPTIITTNCNTIDGTDGLSEALGERATDRLLERNVFVRVKATSYRREIAKQRLNRDREYMS